MRRFILLLMLIPAVLLVGGYIYLRSSLRADIKKEEKRSGDILPSIDSLGGQKLSATDLRPLLIKRLQQLLKKSSNGLYNLSIADLKLDVLASSILLQGVNIKPDSMVLAGLKKSGNLPADVLDIQLDSLRIEGINLDDALTGKSMDYKLIRLVKPVISIHHQKTPVKKDVQEKEDFAQRFLKEMKKLSVQKLVVEEGSITIYNDAKKSPPNELLHVNADLTGIQLDSLTRTDKNRFLFAEKAMLSFSDYSRTTPDGLYAMKIGAVKITAPDNTLQLANFSFTSPLSQAEFVKRQKLSKELYTLTLPAVTIENINWWELLNEEALVADAVAVPGGKLSIYLDRTLPPKNKMGNFPNQLLMKMPIQLNLAKVAINGLDFSYSEYSPASGQTGTVNFNQINLTLRNVCNTAQNKSTPMTAAGTALLMNKVPVTADFSFDLTSHKSGKFSARISTKGFDGTLVNAFTVPMGLLKIERGIVHSTEAVVSGNQWKAQGDVFIPYQDLKLSLLEKDKGENTLDKKGFTSLAANLFVIKNNNPKEGKSARRARINFNRIPEGGFFMLIWKTMLSGILKTIGAPQKIATKTTVVPAKK